MGGTAEKGHTNENYDLTWKESVKKFLRLLFVYSCYYMIIIVSSPKTKFVSPKKTIK